MNVMTVYGGILQYPFYHDEYDDRALYATIGSIIGHELGHALDSTGHLFDQHGTFKTDMWLPSDHEIYNARADCVAREWSRGSPQAATDEPCERLDREHYGLQTLTEDIADVIGVQLAYRAWKSHSQNDNDDHLFFYAFSQMWCAGAASRECNRISGDPHAVSQFRVDKTLQQIAPFYKAFECAVPPTDERCSMFFGKQ